MATVSRKSAARLAAEAKALALAAVLAAAERQKEFDFAVQSQPDRVPVGASVPAGYAEHPTDDGSRLYVGGTPVNCAPIPAPNGTLKFRHKLTWNGHQLFDLLVDGKPLRLPGYGSDVCAGVFGSGVQFFCSRRAWNVFGRSLLGRWSSWSESTKTWISAYSFETRNWTDQPEAVIPTRFNAKPAKQTSPAKSSAVATVPETLAQRVARLQRELAEADAEATAQAEAAEADAKAKAEADAEADAARAELLAAEAKAAKAASAKAARAARKAAKADADAVESPKSDETPTLGPEASSEAVAPPTSGS